MQQDQKGVSDKVFPFAKFLEVIFCASIFWFMASKEKHVLDIDDLVFLFLLLHVIVLMFYVLSLHHSSLGMGFFNK
jgi:hypothetical protein